MQEEAVEDTLTGSWFVGRSVSRDGLIESGMSVRRAYE